MLALFFPKCWFYPMRFSTLRFLMRQALLVPSLPKDLLWSSLRGSVRMKRKWPEETSQTMIQSGCNRQAGLRSVRTAICTHST
ncbi:hypothetical protein N665_2574s0002 [Sinapis alba]|nr:hypothetical protein N665_2574s0002 [Sinapis alba]